MTEPVTELDQPFSQPDATPARWADTRQALEQAQLFWICTVRADGRPHVTPLVAVWLDGALHFATGPDEQKAVNLRQNPQVSLTTGASHWDRGTDLVVEGRAVPVTDDGQLERLAAAWRLKWDGQWEYEARDGAFWQGSGRVLVYAVAPAKVLAFGKGVFAATRHRF